MNASGMVEIADAVFLMNFLFLGGSAPFEPFEECGDPPDGFKVGCETSQCIAGKDLPVLMAMPDGCVQCQECPAPDLQEVVIGLGDFGIKVLNSFDGAAIVCEACDVCPSGRYYVVLVSPEDAESLMTRGWTLWEEIASI